jgi:nicotinate-nucleotide adenylyltransferase
VRIGVYGGTFDPPHRGHLAVACAARDGLALDRVEMVPSHTPPHRRPTTASDLDRLAMVALGVLGERGLVPSPREIRRGGVSYTVETLRELRAEEPAAELFLVMGADSYDDLPNWSRSDEIQRLAHLAVLPRPGNAGVAAVRPADEPRLRPAGEAPPAAGLAVYRVDMEPLAISSREIRRRLGAGEPVEPLVTPAVLGYIGRRGLYRSGGS